MKQQKCGKDLLKCLIAPVTKPLEEGGIGSLSQKQTWMKSDAYISEDTCLMTKLRIQPQSKAPFIQWQAKLNTIIANYPGFVGLEISASKQPEDHEWTIVQRFNSSQYLADWQTYKERTSLLREVNDCLENSKPHPIQDNTCHGTDLQGGVTEVFVTKVSPDKENEFRRWMAKMHQVEASFPGFRGMYVQSPHRGQGHNWITLLQFDTQKT